MDVEHSSKSQQTHTGSQGVTSQNVLPTHSHRCGNLESNCGHVFVQYCALILNHPLHFFGGRLEGIENTAAEVQGGLNLTKEERRENNISF
jgi:hypothetical protein